MFGKFKIVAALALVACSCASAKMSCEVKKEVYAKAVLRDANGTSIGVISLSQATPLDPVKITGDLQGLGAEGKRGFHVHEFGDLSNGCVSTGGHFNPFGKDHGGPTSENRHVGDLGNIIAGANGTSKVEIEDKQISLHSGHRDIIGRAIVLHAGEDDCGLGGKNDSLTTGHAGARFACGVIGYAAAPAPAA